MRIILTTRNRGRFVSFDSTCIFNGFVKREKMNELIT
jgi:hypothetical protein